MVFAAYLLENAILVLSQGGACTQLLSPTVEFLYEPPGPTVGYLQLQFSETKWQMPVGGGNGTLGID